ncbi:MAG: DUF2806 domain-containing protein [Truepera sp.]|nr:DUF2806 domain-containing protein [Truepera sp.]
MELKVTLEVPAVEKVMDYFASSILDPALAPWKARREEKARQIRSEGRVAELQRTAEAHAGAREILLPPDLAIEGELAISDEVLTQTVRFREERKLRSKLAVAKQAAQELGDANVPDHEPDHDWAGRFFNYVGDISSEEMQSLWAKVLAGEIRRPKSISVRALSILRDFDQETAVLFRRLCSVCVSLSEGDEVVDARVILLGGDPRPNALQEYGLDYYNLNILSEYGLIIPDYYTDMGYRMSIGVHPSEPEHDKRIVVPFGFQGRYWILSPTTARHPVDREFTLPGVALTRAGRELSGIVDLEPMDDYALALMKFLQVQNLPMIEVDGPSPIRL